MVDQHPGGNETRPSGGETPALLAFDTRTLLDGLPDGCVVLGFDGTFRYVNDAAALVLRRTSHELLGTPLQQVAPGIEQSAVFDRYRRCMEERTRQRFDAELALPGAPSRWFDLSLSPVPEGIFVLGTEITDRKKAEEELRLSELRHRLLADNARDVIWTMELDGRISYVSPAVERVRGFTPEEAMLQSLEEIHPPASQRISRGYFEQLAADIQAGRTPQSFRGEMEYLCRDGSTFWTEVMAFPLLGADGSVLQILGVTRDIAERKRAEEEIRRSNADLEHRVAARTAELEEALGEMAAFSYSVSHDLRSPLRAIDGFTALLDLGHGGRLDEEGRRLLSTVRANSRRMGVLIDSLLDFSRLGRTELRRSPVDMAGMAREVLAEVVPPGERERVEVRVRDLPGAVGDPRLLRVVFQNLLSNAVKFSEKRDRPFVEVGWCAGPDGPEYFVRDNGVGFDMQYAGKLFGVFQRLCGMDEFEGTGIGLALVRRIVARHGGRVRAEGAVNEGATFSFTLGPAGGGGAGSTPAGAPSGTLPAGPDT